MTTCSLRVGVLLSLIQVCLFDGETRYASCGCWKRQKPLWSLLAH